ncbi:hypothetical protein V5E97_14670 [Singulisphaera sp. Ch08]|uniref:Uncharacterized protein n=1 Tax=Singulisphaera sp. Ch08 TaxID=3120278 RepID=A0AAU7CQA4_9BACT
MLYTVASWEWTSGEPLTPAMAREGLSRWRPKTDRIAATGPIVAVALRYDGTRGQVVAEGVTARGSCGPWSAPAIVDALGSVMVLAAIPASLVRVIGTAEIRVHPGTRSAVPQAHVAVGQTAPIGRFRIAAGRVRSPKRPRFFSFGKSASRLGPTRAGVGTPRLRGIAQPEAWEQVKEAAATASAILQSEVDGHHGSRPPPGIARLYASTKAEWP